VKLSTLQIRTFFELTF